MWVLDIHPRILRWTVPTSSGALLLSPKAILAHAPSMSCTIVCDNSYCTHSCQRRVPEMGGTRKDHYYHYCYWEDNTDLFDSAEHRVDCTLLRRQICKLRRNVRNVPFDSTRLSHPQWAI